MRPITKQLYINRHCRERAPSRIPVKKVMLALQMGMTKRRVMKRRVILESYDFGELCVNHAQTTLTFTNDHTQFLNSLDVFLNGYERVIFDVTLFR